MASPDTGAGLPRLPGDPDAGRLHVTMTTAAKRRQGREKVRAHRARLRRCGLRPVQVWLPVHSPALVREMRRQAAAIAKSEHEADDQAFVDAISDWPNE